MPNPAQRSRKRSDDYYIIRIAGDIGIGDRWRTKRGRWSTAQHDAMPYASLDAACAVAQYIAVSEERLAVYVYNQDCIAQKVLSYNHAPTEYPEVDG